MPVTMSDLPPDVKQSVEIGLTTGKMGDRMIALGMANEEDFDRDCASQYGSTVVQLFLEQMGRKLEPAQWRTDYSDGHWENRQGAAARLMVSQAIGGEIGVQTTFYKILGKVPDSDFRAALVSNSLEFGVDSPIDRVRRTGPDSDQPFYVEHEATNNRGINNFCIALNAVKGVLLNGVKPDEAWFADLESIRNL